MKNIFIDLDFDKIYKLTGEDFRNKIMSLSKKNNITKTTCMYMWRDIVRINKCQARVIKMASKIW